jgi:hypothetical protein
MTISGRHQPGQIPYVNAEGRTYTEMWDNLRQHPNFEILLSRGDVELVWVNQDEIDIHNMNIEFGAYRSDPDRGI